MKSADIWGTQAQALRKIEQLNHPSSGMAYAFPSNMKIQWVALFSGLFLMLSMPFVKADDAETSDSGDEVTLVKVPEELKFEQFRNPNYDLSFMRNEKDHVHFTRHGDRHRGFVASKQGTFMVMVSNTADDPTNTVSGSLGSRTFWFFPVRQEPAKMINESADAVDLSLPMGGRIGINQSDGSIAWIQRMDFVENPTIRKVKRTCNEKKEPGSCGGFEVKRARFGLVLDMGWAAGGSTISRPHSVSTLIDTAGTRCSVKNEDLFVYSQKDNPTLKYSDEKLVKYLAKKCPNLLTEDLLKPLPLEFEVEYHAPGAPAVENPPTETPPVEAPVETPPLETPNEEPLPIEIDAISGADPLLVPRPKIKDSSGPVTSPSEVPSDGKPSKPQGPVTSPSEVEDQPVNGPVTSPAQVPAGDPNPATKPEDVVRTSPSGGDGPADPYPEN